MVEGLDVLISGLPTSDDNWRKFFFLDLLSCGPLDFNCFNSEYSWFLSSHYAEIPNHLSLTDEDHEIELAYNFNDKSYNKILGERIGKMKFKKGGPKLKAVPAVKNKKLPPPSVSLVATSSTLKRKGNENENERNVKSQLLQPLLSVHLLLRVFHIVLVQISFIKVPTLPQVQLRWWDLTLELWSMCPCTRWNLLLIVIPAKS